jgi:flagellar biosynthesis/type III secretory pathway ATPase
VLPDGGSYQGPMADVDRALLAEHILLTAGLANELHQVVATILRGALRQAEDDVSKWLAQRARELEGLMSAP